MTFFSASFSCKARKDICFSTRSSFRMRNSLSKRYRGRWMRIRMGALLSGSMVKSRETGPGDATTGKVGRAEKPEARSQKRSFNTFQTARQPARLTGGDVRIVQRILSPGGQKGGWSRARRQGLSSKGCATLYPKLEDSVDPRAELGQLANVPESLLSGNFSANIKLLADTTTEKGGRRVLWDRCCLVV